MVKRGNTISIFENGKNNRHDITVDAADSGQPAYGNLLFDSNTLILGDFRHGGFGETGNKVELSYIENRATEFKNYTAGKSYLVVDRSGTGNFEPDQVTYYQSDEIDATRSKIIFNNVFWDMDGSGADVFTFAYRISNIMGEVKATDPGCQNDVSQNDGSIEFLAEEGFRGFSYSLTNKTVQEPDKTGTFFTGRLVIDSLKAGTYSLKIQELGGCNLIRKENDQQPAKAVSSAYFATTTGAFLEWTVAEAGTKASAGFMFTPTGSFTDPQAISINYGIRMDGFNLYAIINGQQAASPFASVKAGDRIKIERTSSQMLFKVNNQQITSSSIVSPNYTYGVARIDSPSGAILNLKWDSGARITQWRTSAGMKAEYSSGDAIVKDVILNAPCDGQLRSKTDNNTTTAREAVEESAPRFTVFSGQTSSHPVSARLVLKSPGRSSLVVFTLTGRLTWQKELDPHLADQVTDLPRLTPGVYIIKAITPEGEFSAKFIVR